MLQPPSIDALRSALDPVEALRGEQSELEIWVRESFAALDALHDELTEWQRDLTRQQAELDQREAGVAERDRAKDEHRALASELREMRRLLEHQSDMLVSLGAVAPNGEPGEEDELSQNSDDPAGGDGLSLGSASRESELRRPASTRRAQPPPN